jgi:NADH dehydrogenase
MKFLLQRLPSWSETLRRANLNVNAGKAMSAGTRKQVLILGGFGGLYTALGLEKTLARENDVEITLVNRQNFSLFTPMLHEVAASDLDMTHIVNPVRKLLRHVQFFHGEVERIDLTSKQVTVVHGQERHTHELRYDYLVLALGSTTNFFGLPELEHRAMTMKSLSDAIHLRNQLIDLLEEADFECAAGSRPNLLTVVVAGGGFAGTETIAAVNDFMRDSRANEEAVLIFHVGSARISRPKDRCSEHSWNQLLWLCCLVSVADDLSE